MGKFQDLTGRRFGRWEVLGSPERQRGQIVWRCRCDCGTERPVHAGRLRSGGSTSCGCIVRNPDPADVTARRFFKEIVRNAKTRGISVSITADDYKRVASAPCHYCGALPAPRTRSTRRWAGSRPWTPVTLHGLDRVDSARGYDLGNVVSCCAWCNRAKSDRTVADFIAWARRIVEHADH